jgi:xanthine dehydrogenase accessory factor
LHRIPLAASLGQCCGGVAQLLFEPMHGDAKWLETLAALCAERKACALVVPVRGDAAESRLVVTASEALGTVGASGHDAPRQRSPARS